MLNINNFFITGTLAFVLIDSVTFCWLVSGIQCFVWGGNVIEYLFTI